MSEGLYLIAYIVLHSESNQRRKIRARRDVNVGGLRELCCTPVPWAYEDPVDDRRFGELPSKCVFATTAADDKNGLRVGHGGV